MKSLILSILLIISTSLPANFDKTHLAYEARTSVVVKMLADHVEQLEGEVFVNEGDHRYLYVLDLGWVDDGCPCIRGCRWIQLHKPSCWHECDCYFNNNNH